MEPSAQTLLLVEDNRDDADLIKRAFRQAKLANRIELVSDGDAAVDYLSGEGRYADRTAYPLPVLVLLDLKLPRRSGFEVLSWLRQHPRLKRMPVVVLTSSHETADLARAYDAGVNSYLVKPVESEALLEMVKTLGLYWMIFNERPVLEER